MMFSLVSQKFYTIVSYKGSVFSFSLPLSSSQARSNQSFGCRNQKIVVGSDIRYNVPMDAMHVIDFADQTCAGDLIPLIEKAILLIQPGETIQVVARDPILTIDIAAWCSRSGNNLACLPDPKEGIYFIQKG